MYWMYVNLAQHPNIHIYYHEPKLGEGQLGAERKVSMHYATNFRECSPGKLKYINQGEWMGLIPLANILELYDAQGMRIKSTYPPGRWNRWYQPAGGIMNTRRAIERGEEGVECTDTLMAMREREGIVWSVISTLNHPSMHIRTCEVTDAGMRERGWGLDLGIRI